MVVDTPGGGPAVMPSGHARHNRLNSGKEFLPCQSAAFPTTSNWPHLLTVLTAPVKTKRSPLDVKAPAQSALSHADAQTHRLPNRIESATLSHVRKNEYKDDTVFQSEEYVFAFDGRTELTHGKHSDYFGKDIGSFKDDEVGAMRTLRM
jgi:hypothetical protein